MAGKINHVEFSKDYPEVASDIAVNIRNRREDLGWTQSDLARAVGVDHSYISRLEAGERIPSVSMLARLARVMGGALWLGF